jgi:hypothetical protein
MICARINLLLVIVATSFVTLMVFNYDQAQRLWAPYAVISFLLSVTDLLADRKRRKARKYHDAT